MGGHPPAEYSYLRFPVGPADDQRRLASPGVIVHSIQRDLQENREEVVCLTLKLRFQDCFRYGVTDLTAIFRTPTVGDTPGRIVATVPIGEVIFADNKAEVTFEISDPELKDIAFLNTLQIEIVDALDHCGGARIIPRNVKVSYTSGRVPLVCLCSCRGVATHVCAGRPDPRLGSSVLA